MMEILDIYGVEDSWQLSVRVSSFTFHNYTQLSSTCFDVLSNDRAIDGSI